MTSPQAHLFRAPTEADAARLYRLVGETGGLERNTCYAYLLLCSHFAATSLIAERDGAAEGVVFAYRPPTAPEELFVWQIGVAPSARGQGLAGRMLEQLLERPACRDARFLTATISDEPARRTFLGVARRRGVAMSESVGFLAASFAEPHADERLLRVGPLAAGRPQASAAADEEPPREPSPMTHRTS